MKIDRKMIYSAGIAVLAVLFCSGCETVFENPLSDPSHARLDERLFGKWVCTDEKDKDVVLQFKKISDTETSILFITKDPKEKDTVLIMFPTTVGKHSYMNLYLKDEGRDKGYMIAKYQLSGDQMTIWIFDTDKIRPAITQGKLKGHPGPGTGVVTITDSSDHVAAFLQGSDNEQLFEYFGAFKKSAK